MKRLLLIFLMVGLVAPLSGMELIEDFTVTKNRVEIKINKTFAKKFLKTDRFYAEYSEDIDLTKLDRTVLELGLLGNCIGIIWAWGKTLTIEAMDEDFYNSLPIIKEVFRRMYPKESWGGELVPQRLVKNTFTQPVLEPGEKERTALLFSGGLDSITSSLMHRDKKQLLVTVNGHWDLPLWDKKLLAKRRVGLEAWGQKYGHENTFINSNYYDFLNRDVLDKYIKEISSWRIFTVEGIGWAGLAAPVMAIKGYQQLLHGSTITWEYNFPACANPFIDDNLHFAGMRIKHDLFDMHRLSKCDYIARTCKEEGLEKPYIRVCEEKTVTNCCKCQKCIRTILELVVVGENPQEYGFNCDVDKVLQKTRNFMDEHGTGSTTVWHFKHIQKRLLEKHAQGEQIPESLQWLLTYDLSKKITSEIKCQKRLDWRTFCDLLPGICVPDTIEPAF